MTSEVNGPFRSTPDQTIDRRRLLGRLAAAGAAAPVLAAMNSAPMGALTAMAQDATPEGTPSPQDVLASIGKDPRMIVRGTTLFETPFELIDDILTPNELFFIRSNGPLTIEADPATWSLTVDGLVDTPLELSLADLQAMEQRTLTVFVECSGNSRSRFGDEPTTVSGTLWGNGAIGNAEWTGVPLADILTAAGVEDGAVDIVCQGADFPEMQRGLPLENAMNRDVLVALQMNGTDILNPHGGPLRLIVPGWGGIASIKWLTSLTAIDRAFDGTFNTESYVRIDEEGRVLEPVWQMPVKSVITNILPDSQLTAGTQTIAGYAWSGFGMVEMIEVSTDGGANWQEATITMEAGRLSWVRFEYQWDATAGQTTLMSRATDERGLTQPDEVPWNAKGYQMNAIDPVAVTVAELYEEYVQSGGHRENGGRRFVCPIVSGCGRNTCPVSLISLGAGLFFLANNLQLTAVPTQSTSGVTARTAQMRPRPPGQSVRTRGRLSIPKTPSAAGRISRSHST